MLNSKKDIVEKIEIWKKLEELHLLQYYMLYH